MALKLTDRQIELLEEFLAVASTLVDEESRSTDESTTPKLPTIGPTEDRIDIADKIVELPYSNNYLSDLYVRFEEAIEDQQSADTDMAVNVLKSAGLLIKALLV